MKVKNKYPAIKNNLMYAAYKINNGDPIIYPTDTLYGFGVDATNSEAIVKLNNVKGRTNPLSIILNDIEDIKLYADVSKESLKEIEDILPGPFTILLKSKNNPILSKNIQLSSDLIGIRIINNDFCNNLIEMIGKPIVTTSVNYHGKPALSKINDIDKEFNQICFFYSKNLSSDGSTIIDFSKSIRKIIRYGDGDYPKK